MAGGTDSALGIGAPNNPPRVETLHQGLRQPAHMVRPERLSKPDGQAAPIPKAESVARFVADMRLCRRSGIGATRRLNAGSLLYLDKLHHAQRDVRAANGTRCSAAAISSAAHRNRRVPLLSQELIRQSPQLRITHRRRLPKRHLRPLGKLLFIHNPEIQLRR